MAKPRVPLLEIERLRIGQVTLRVPSHAVTSTARSWREITGRLRPEACLVIADDEGVGISQRQVEIVREPCSGEVGLDRERPTRPQRRRHRARGSGPAGAAAGSGSEGARHFPSDQAAVKKTVSAAARTIACSLAESSTLRTWIRPL